MTSQIFNDNKILALLPQFSSDIIPTDQTDVEKEPINDNISEHFRSGRKGGGSRGGGRRGGGRRGGGRRGGGRRGGGRRGGGRRGGRHRGGGYRRGGRYYSPRYGNRYYSYYPYYPYYYPSATGYYDHYDINNSPWGINIYDYPLDYLYNSSINDYNTYGINEPTYSVKNINLPLIETQTSQNNTSEGQIVLSTQWVYLLLSAAFIMVLLYFFKK